MGTALKTVLPALVQLTAWQDNDIDIVQCLGDGPSNTSWLILHNTKQYVFRIDKPFVTSLDLDRDNEEAVLRCTSYNDLSPDLVFSDPDSGLMLTSYLNGHTWTSKALGNKQNLILLAKTLKQLHQLNPQVKQYDLQAGLRRYQRALNNPESDQWTFEALSLLDKVNEAPLVLCHNDLHARNIHSGDTLRFIDWEYAGLGNPMFDLVTVIQHHQLNDALIDVFLTAYYENLRPATITDIARFRQIYDRLLALWYSMLIGHGHDEAHNLLLLNQIKHRITIS